MISRRDVVEASERIAGRVRYTPVIAYGDLVLKLELLQHAGSFKPRGTFNRVLQSPIPEAGLIAASGGNHGLAVAYAARQLGVPAEIFVPTIASPTKVAGLRSLGADLRIVGDYYADALFGAELRQRSSGALSVHAYNNPAVVAGQGTVALEFQTQAPDVTTVLVSVGGGGLAAGIAAYYGGDVRVVAVETTHTNAYAAAREAGAPVTLDLVGGLAADSLGASSIGDVAFGVLDQFDVQSVVVDDEAVRTAQRALWRDLRLVAEPGGATALAAILSGAYEPSADEKVGVIVCGSNTDPQSVT